MREAAAWVLNGTHWFSTLQQPMMIIVWCHNWEDASKFQYLMQMLQSHFHGDFVPRYQIFMYDHDIYGSFPQWQEPSTVWDGTPVIGFMAETFLDDLSTGWLQGLQSNVDISYNVCESMLGCNDIRYASMACW